MTTINHGEEYQVINVDPIAFAVCASGMSAAIPWQLIDDHRGNSESKRLLYEELCRFALLSTQMYEQICNAVTVDCKGDYLEEVDQKFAQYFAQSLVMEKSIQFDSMLLMLGKLVHELFQKTPRALHEVTPIIAKFTGYEANESHCLHVVKLSQPTQQIYH